MARKPRIHFPDACYHVILRGNQDRAVFFHDKDRFRFFRLIEEGIMRFEYRVHAFCLMTNHIHLILQVGDIPLSRIMQNLSFRYTQDINRRRKRQGHLFQGRYKALLIDADRYLLELIRYIHLNPVRAKMVKNPENYPWSSHKAYLGSGLFEWLTTDWLLSRFSKQNRTARKEYADFISKGRGEKKRKEFYTGSYDGRILGDEDFVQRMIGKTKAVANHSDSLDNIIQLICDQYEINPDLLFHGGRNRNISEARSMIALFVRESEHLKLTEFANKLNRDLSGLSQAATRLERRIITDKKLEKIFKNINNLLK